MNPLIAYPIIDLGLFKLSMECFGIWCHKSQSNTQETGKWSKTSMKLLKKKQNIIFCL